MLTANDLTATDYKIIKFIQDQGIHKTMTDDYICKAFPFKGTYARLEKLQEDTAIRKACICRIVPLDKIPRDTPYEAYQRYSAFTVTEYGRMLLADWEDDRHDEFWFIDLKSSSAVLISILSLLISFYSAVIK